MHLQSSGIGVATAKEASRRVRMEKVFISANCMETKSEQDCELLSVCSILRIISIALICGLKTYDIQRNHKLPFKHIRIVFGLAISRGIAANDPLAATLLKSRPYPLVADNNLNMLSPPFWTLATIYIEC